VNAILHTLTDTEDKPFGEYWALRAMGRSLGQCDAAKKQELQPQVIPALQVLDRKFGPGTDRQREVAELLREIQTMNAKP
jgi:hypothetical protein